MTVPPRSLQDPTVVEKPLPLPASERTIIDPPAEALKADARSRTIADRPTSDRLVTQPTTLPVIPDVGIDKYLDPNALNAGRYAIGELLGTGSSSHVYAGHDRNFDREVAIKFLETGLAQDARRLSRFVREARMTARLDHPNIVPVYDLDSTPTGDLYLTMRRVNGLSLGDAVRRAADGDLPSELGDMYRRVNILLKVCDALSCAHDRGIAHLDVKPDNIMLGPFGEVVLVDWGLARRFDEEPRVRQHITGTPAYMSPEQCVGHPGDTLADVYCLGATLFHVLTLRHPTWGTDEGEFWSKKRAGVIDPPTAEERARIPKQVLAIALKALACDRADRYQSVKELGEDLQNYQAGLSVSAYRESWVERALRWHRLHARPLWMGVAAAAAVISSALFVYGERLKEVVAWGSPIYNQSFSNDSWRADFIDVGNLTQWGLQDGRLVSLGKQGSFLFLPQRFYGPVAVEFEGEMLPGHPPCDLSLAWSPTDPASDPHWLGNAYLLQTGANDNTFAAITRRAAWPSANDVLLARSAVRLKPGVRYHLRFEIDDDRLSIILDGKRICEYQDSFPCASGYIGLYAYYPGKAFDDLVVYTKGVPQRVVPTAIGDAFYQRGLPVEAAEQYRLVAESFAGSVLADTARYRQGLCLAKLGRDSEALALWDSLRDPTQIGLAQCLRIGLSNAAGDVTGAVSRFSALYRDHPDLRPRLHLIFATSIDVASRGKDEKSVDQWLSLTNDLLPRESTVDAAAAKALNSLGRWETVLERYPHIDTNAAWALLALGRPTEVLRRYPGVRVMEALALVDLGRFDDLRDYDFPYVTQRILHIQGQHEKAMSFLDPNDQAGHPNGLLWLGRPAEALAESKREWGSWHLAMIQLGRIDEVLAEERANPHDDFVFGSLRARNYDEVVARAQRWGRSRGSTARLGHFGLWLTALERHDQATAKMELAAAESANSEYNPYLGSPWFMPLIAVEFVRAHGDSEVFATAMRRLIARGADWEVQRPWHAARYLLGEIDESAYLSQPARDHATAALQVLRGLRAELAGDREAAGAGYRDYLALPLHRRAWDMLEGDPITDHFVAWRLAEMGR